MQKRPPGRQRRRRIILKTNLLNQLLESVENVKRGSSFESGDEPPGSMKGTKLHLLIDYQLKKHDRVQFNLYITCVFEKENTNTQRSLHAVILLDWNSTMKRK
jgi:hypothetical protein